METQPSWATKFPTDLGYRWGKRSGQKHPPRWDGEGAEVIPNVKGLVDKPGEQEAKERREARSR